MSEPSRGVRTAATSAGPPNVVILLPDQLRPDFLGCYGADFVATPAMDALADEAVRYTRAYSSSPLCVPARTALHTGLHPLRTGVLDNIFGLRPDYSAVGIRTLPEQLADAGYLTAAVGKLHFYPWDDRQGYQYRLIAEDKRHLNVRDDYWHFLADHGREKRHGSELPGYAENNGAAVTDLPWDLSVDHFVGEAACHFIREHADEQPFALVVGFPGPHDPYDPNEEFLAKVDRERLPQSIPAVPGDADRLHANNRAYASADWARLDLSDFPESTKQTMRAHYAALIAQIDLEVGRIVETLRAVGADDNTVIILASDHGDCLGDYDHFGKGVFFESAARIPLLVRLPGGVGRGTTSNALVDLYDLHPSILQICGLPVRSMVDAQALPDPVVAGADARRCIVGALADGWMIRTDRYKLHRYMSGECLLFDIEEDPHEQHNLCRSGEHRDILADLDAQLTTTVMRLVARGRDDLAVIDDAGFAGRGQYGCEGWQRRFPRELGACGDQPEGRSEPLPFWPTSATSEPKRRRRPPTSSP